MGFAGTQLIANLHDEYGFMLLDDGIFSFLGGQVGVFILQLLRGDKGYIAAQFGCDAGVFFLYDFERITVARTMPCTVNFSSSIFLFSGVITLSQSHWST